MSVLRILLLLLLCINVVQSQTEFSQENAAQILRVLSVEIGPRPMGSPAEQRALNYAIAKFREYGCDTAYIMPFTSTAKVNTKSGIAVGIKRGVEKRILAIGGHIDSSGPEIPGADDDGSGCATVMEIARVMGHRSTQSTLVFLCFGGEEEGLQGSSYFVDHFEEIDSVALMLQVDMANGLGVFGINPDTHGASAPSWLVSAAIEEYAKLGYNQLTYETHFFSLNYATPVSSGSDHESFLRAGVPAIDFTTDVTKPIHTPRDTYENFDPRGLKRTGDLVLKLIKRFDKGTPDRTIGQYWLYLFGTVPFFVPIWGIYIFVVLAVILALVAFLTLYRKHLVVDVSQRVHWSGMKAWILTLLVVGVGWLSIDIVGLLRGSLHPWLTSIDRYYVLAALAMLMAISIASRIAIRLRLSADVMWYYFRAVIILVLFVFLFGFISIKLAVEPAVALTLISLAFLIRHAILRTILLVLAPVWMMRVVFSDWGLLYFRTIALQSSPGFSGSMILNALIILSFTLYVLPFTFTAIGVVRDTPIYSRIPSLLRSKSFFLASLGASILWTGYLLTLPVYDELWYRNVQINQQYDMKRYTKDISIQGGDYLTGLVVRHGTTDTTIESRTTSVNVPLSGVFDTSWVQITRAQRKERQGDTTVHTLHVSIDAARRPLRVRATYTDLGEAGLATFRTPWKFRTRDSVCTIEWYSFPDSVLDVPVTFATTGSGDVYERIEVTFADLAYPMRCTLPQSYIIPRTNYVSTAMYSRNTVTPDTAELRSKEGSMLAGVQK